MQQRGGGGGHPQKAFNTCVQNVERNVGHYFLGRQCNYFRGDTANANVKREGHILRFASEVKFFFFFFNYDDDNGNMTAKGAPLSTVRPENVQNIFNCYCGP